ncbi:hypothetical protein QQF64_009559, partial [Cirrhinus molitorella]
WQASLVGTSPFGA